jgi:hypothetical protein
VINEYCVGGNIRCYQVINYDIVMGKCRGVVKIDGQLLQGYKYVVDLWCVILDQVINYGWVMESYKINYCITLMSVV